MQSCLSFYINGAWVAPSAPQPLDVINPATEQVVGQIMLGNAQDVNKAVAAAKAAFPAYARTSVDERVALLEKIGAAYKERYAEMVETISSEMGAPIWLCKAAQAAMGPAHLNTAIEVLKNYVFEEKRGNITLRREPVGVCGFITPWNWPINQIACKVLPALAAGCTMVIKPAEQSPLTALHLGKLWEEAGGPPGTLQILPCRDPIPVSRVLMDDARIRKISFTGSTEVGMLLYAQAARTMKRMSLELGGHAPFIVFGDADVHAAVREVVASKFRNAGQTCVCANRVYVHGSIVDEFTFLLATATEALRVGDPLDPATQVGPLVDEAAVAKVESHVADALVRGAGIVTGGTRLNGRFFSPTVLTGVAPGMRILEEETFGPVAPVLSFADDDAVVRAANDTSAGLAAYIWTRDLSRAFRVSEALDYGIVGVNDGVPSTPQAPFGGVKFSGLGREGGHQGIAEYLDVQYVSFGLDA